MLYSLQAQAELSTLAIAGDSTKADLEKAIARHTSAGLTWQVASNEEKEVKKLLAGHFKKGARLFTCYTGVLALLFGV
jgi:hypothetical protein